MIQLLKLSLKGDIFITVSHQLTIHFYRILCEKTKCKAMTNTTVKNKMHSVVKKQRQLFF